MTAKELISSRNTVLEYRPVNQNGSIVWYWVLLPLPAEERALESGEGDSRAEAGLKARQAAHRLRRKITSVRVFGLAKASIGESQKPLRKHSIDYKRLHERRRVQAPVVSEKSS